LEDVTTSDFEPNPYKVKINLEMFWSWMYYRIHTTTPGLY